MSISIVGSHVGNSRIFSGAAAMRSSAPLSPWSILTGAAVSDAVWLCFLDADVRSAPLLLATAVTEAIKFGLDLLSLTPRQELGSFAGNKNSAAVAELF
jgi:hypothetical protein